MMMPASAIGKPDERRSALLDEEVAPARAALATFFEESEALLSGESLRATAGNSSDSSPDPSGTP